MKVCNNEGCTNPVERPVSELLQISVGFWQAKDIKGQQAETCYSE